MFAWCYRGTCVLYCGKFSISVLAASPLFPIEYHPISIDPTRNAKSGAPGDSSIDKMIIELLKNGLESKSAIEPKFSNITQLHLPTSSTSQATSNDPSFAANIITPQLVTKLEEPSDDKQQQVEGNDEDEEEESKLTIEESFQLPDTASPEG